jgi:hypothetical protein
MKTMKPILLGAALLAPFSASAQIISATGGSIQGDTCVGIDCVSSESFGFDSFRLKENNLRLHFDDTSSSASFPANDWRIIINDTDNGGASYFSVEDATGNARPFTIEAGAANHALYVDDGERVGMGTSTPVTELHMVDGDSPTIRLEQDGSSGFAAQTWDLAGNETNFFVRDVTNGSRLPLRIRPGAPSNSIFIDGNSFIGMGTPSPDEPLHVSRTVDASVLVENTTATAAPRTLFKLQNAGNTKFEIAETSQGQTWAFTNSGADFRISRQGSGTVEFLMDNSGNLTIAGALTESSDRDSKQDIVPVDPDAVLAEVLGLDVSWWEYKDSPGVKHVGPMAQDFHAAFGLGASDKGISTLDSAGVALASIQALARRNEVQADELEALRAEVAQLKQANGELGERLMSLESDRDRLKQLEVMVRQLVPGPQGAVTRTSND